MELMCVSSGAMWIHSETKKEGPKDPSMKKLLSGIPGWEAENAVYLQKLKNAKIVTPEIMLPFLRKLDRSSSVQALPSFCPESIAQ